MNDLGVIPAGVLVAASAWGIHQHLGAGKWSTLCAIAITVGGVCLAGTAVSPWRGSSTTPDFTLLQNQLHLLFAVVGFLSLACAPAFVALHARGSAAFGHWFVPSILAAAAVALFGFFPAPAAYRGLCQRVALGSFFAWQIVLCSSLLRSVLAARMLGS